MAAVRLATLLLLVGLTASRLGLVLHEVGGHWGVAASLGCRLTGLRLFLFGGGYVDYDCPPLAAGPSLAIDLGGIALELAVGGLLVGLARRRGGIVGLLAVATGLLFVLHGLFYLVTGVHYGVGDGRQLHGLLGAARAGLVAGASLALVGLTFAAAGRLARRLAPALVAPRWRTRVATLAVAALAAAAGHGALMRLEQRVVADRAYAATFQPEHERQIAVQLQRFEQQQPRAPEEVAARREVLVAQHGPPFPLTPVLGGAMGLAALAGIALALRTPAPGAGARRPAIAGAALACGLSIALAIAIDRWF